MGLKEKRMVVPFKFVPQYPHGKENIENNY